MSDLDQAWAEIRDCMADDLLNAAQKKAFVISILKGQLANPPGEADTKPLVGWDDCHYPERRWGVIKDCVAFGFNTAAIDPLHAPGEADKSPIPDQGET